MPARVYNGGTYRFGYNGKEMDNEVAGNGNHIDYGARGRDPRLGGGWWSVDPLQKNYPSLTPYNYASNSPIKFVDFDGKDFGVDVNHTDKVIIIKMNVYTIDKQATNQAQAAAGEINSLNSKVSISGTEYQVKFQVSVIPSISAEKDAQNDPLGNLYEGTTQNTVATATSDDRVSAVGGETRNGWSTHMNNVTFPDGSTEDLGSKSQLVAHEFLHLLGQNDEGGEYFDKKGRMKYSATQNNGFEMNKISDADVTNIVKYASVYGGDKAVKKPGQKDKVHAAQVVKTESGSGQFSYQSENIKTSK